MKYTQNHFTVRFNRTSK